MNKELKNLSEIDLKKQMVLLDVDHRINKDSLRKAFQQKIRMHHTDKGGDEETAKAVTSAYRLLSACLETGRRLPRRHTCTDINTNFMSTSTNISQSQTSTKSDVNGNPGDNGNSNQSSHSSNTSQSQSQSQSQNQQRRRSRKGFPYYKVEDDFTGSTTFFFDEMNDNIFSSQYSDKSSDDNVTRFLDKFMEDFMPRYRYNYSGYF